MLLRHNTLSLSSITSFYSEHQKSPFAHQPWESGRLRFRFIIGELPPSPWEDFQSNRKTLAVIGVCQCPSSPVLRSVANQFTAASNSYSSALVQRCFAFCHGDSQPEDESYTGSNLVLFPLADRQTQEFHLQTIVQDIAASLLMEFEKWVLQAESSGTILKTPSDSQTSFCFRGDLNFRLSRQKSGNLVVHRKQLEITFSWLDHLLMPMPIILLHWTLLDQLGIFYGMLGQWRTAFVHFWVSPLSFEFEATLKLARFSAAHVFLSIRRELAKEVMELLTAAADGVKSLIDASDRLIVYVEIARLFGSLSYHRKAAFFSRQVAQLYLQQDNKLAAISGMQVLAMTTKAYRYHPRMAPSH